MYEVEVELMVDDVECFLEKTYRKMHDKNKGKMMSGGKQRGSSCKTNEDVMARILTHACVLNGLTVWDYQIVKGDNKSNAFTITNPGGSVSIGVDWHLYIDQKLVLINECKSYLDAAFLERAHSYMRKIKSMDGHEDVVSIVTAVERAVDKDTLGHYMHDDVIDGCYFFMDGSRTSAKPIYMAEFWRGLNRNYIREVITFVDNAIINTKKIKNENRKYYEQGV